MTNMKGHGPSLAFLLIFICPSVVSDNCWIARTGQTEWCNGYCCDTTHNGWSCCCDEGDDVQTIVLGLFALLILAFGIVFCVVKVILCYLGGDIYAHVYSKVKRKLAKLKRGDLRQLSDHQRLRSLLKERASRTYFEEWRKMAKESAQEDTDDEMGHELSCLCCNTFRVSFGKV